MHHSLFVGCAREWVRWVRIRTLGESLFTTSLTQFCIDRCTVVADLPHLVISFERTIHLFEVKGVSG